MLVIISDNEATSLYIVQQIVGMVGVGIVEVGTS